jgi:hypothetical protein
MPKNIHKGQNMSEVTSCTHAHEPPPPKKNTTKNKVLPGIEPGLPEDTDL